jgi:hypothetical protein
MQPIHEVEGVVRFVENRIVTAVLARSFLDLNEIAVGASRGKYSDSEVEQFWQLIGYSLSGYCDCQNTIRPKVLDRVWKKLCDWKGHKK